MFPQALVLPCAHQLRFGLTKRWEQLQSLFGSKARVSALVPKNELEILSAGSFNILLVSGHRPHHLLLW